MNILFLEDRGSVSFYVKENLEGKGHVVFDVFGILDAQSYWEDEDIHCIILDLNLSPEGLSEDEVGRSKNGLLTGWVWFKEYVVRNKETMKKRTIIFSEYLDQLKKEVQNNELQGITLIAKRNTEGSPIEQLLAAVDRIALYKINGE